MLLVYPNAAACISNQYFPHFKRISKLFNNPPEINMSLIDTQVPAFKANACQTVDSSQ